MHPKPLVLCILDGFGHSDSPAHNAVAAARTPTLDALKRDYPHGLINASELHVGLPEGQMGNSEVGHMNIGSGRVLMQELPKIDAAIASGELSVILSEALAKSKDLLKIPRPATSAGLSRDGTVHLLGLLSDGGVHSHIAHMVALANMLAQMGKKVQVHLFLDGRDTPPQSALRYVEQFEQQTKAQPNIVIVTVSGRYYAMDRDKRWDRVQKAYETLVFGVGNRFASAKEAIVASYAANITDEFLLPCVIGDYAGMQDGDSLICANFRADRVREILAAILLPEFKDFARIKTVQIARAIGMVEYSKALAPFMQALFPPEPLNEIFGEIIAHAGLTQLRIAETEKYAHVTFFFNGGREQEFPGEERILVPSPLVATYDEKPEMSAYEVTDKMVAAIEAERFDVVVVNYANCDMVGHSGDLLAATRAVEAVDSCLGRLWQAVSAKGGALLVTADHGNAEMMFDNSTRQPHTAHTLNLVPVIIAVPSLKGSNIPLPEGKLGDIAPTLLQLLGLPQPAAMTGLSLLAGHDL